ncbi:lipopolysaccharide core heptose(I) kinase RfaP [Neptuniibacter sp.]|uniref:lipopolysaccharide core heptose(I) kinase RfaP n=1 Tax=Neptuniibacter sp. TaxID=1962643 RepID=UPI002602E72A|nr:lipopolysaccharide core heptose(I) kinase RfaP [Neptuniibacter sp.]MCP4596439.1 lipopolysaccharide core heptose(I) kinase RfaP [Neptuniibacter sp.]
MSVIINSETVKRWLADRDPFEAVKSIQGKVVRSKEGRTTQRFEIEGKGFYAKLHEGVGWKEVIKNLVQLRLPVVGARNEWEAIALIQSLGLKTLDAVAYGKKGLNPAAQTSFLITRELTETYSLAQYCEPWLDQAPHPSHKRKIIDRVAYIARTIHENGINHRDLYLCHFLLDQSEEKHPQNPDFFLVDLHRAQIRSQVPERWLVKDVASIYFSAMDIGLTRRDVFRFIKVYTGLPLRQALQQRQDFWQKVQARARQLYIRDWKREPNDLFAKQ